jgi:hypothetical protein
VLEELGRFPDDRSAVRALLENIDEPAINGPVLTHNPLENYTAAPALSRCGAIARSEILASCRNELTERKLHMMAYVLVLLDKDEGVLYDTDVTVFRLMRELRHPEGRFGRQRDTAEVYGKNLRRMISMMLEPLFFVRDFPPASAGKDAAIEPSAKSK